MINMRARTFILLHSIAAAGTAICCYGASDLPLTVIGGKDRSVQINLAEDEMILPPYLVRFEGGPKMNVTPATKPPRTVKPKELFDFGDSFRLLPRLSFQVIGREKFQWVGGGVFEGRFFGPMISKNENPYGFHIDRGWARVWVDEADGIRIEAPNGWYFAHQAQFWMYVQGGETEVYLLSGSLKGPDGTEIAEPKYVKWKADTKSPAFSKDWTPEGLEAKIKSVYPGLMDLVKTAHDEWEDEKPQETFAEIRKNGWRKASRSAPGQR